MLGVDGGYGFVDMVWCTFDSDVGRYILIYLSLGLAFCVTVLVVGYTVVI